MHQNYPIKQLQLIVQKFYYELNNLVNQLELTNTPNTPNDVCPPFISTSPTLVAIAPVAMAPVAEKPDWIEPMPQKTPNEPTFFANSLLPDNSSYFKKCQKCFKCGKEAPVVDITISDFTINVKGLSSRIWCESCKAIERNYLEVDVNDRQYIFENIIPLNKKSIMSYSGGCPQFINDKTEKVPVPVPVPVPNQQACETNNNQKILTDEIFKDLKPIPSIIKEKEKEKEMPRDFRRDFRECYYCLIASPEVHIKYNWNSNKTFNYRAFVLCRHCKKTTTAISEQITSDEMNSIITNILPLNPDSSMQYTYSQV